jgi:hypothetical protein
VQPAQAGGDQVEVIDHVVTLESGPQVGPEVGGEASVAPAEQEAAPERAPAEAVHGDHRVDVVEEGGHGRRLVRAALDGRDVPAQVGRLADGVERGSGPGRHRLGHHVGPLLERAAVERHEPEPRAQLEHLLDALTAQQLGEHGPRLTRPTA